MVEYEPDPDPRDTEQPPPTEVGGIGAFGLTDLDTPGELVSL